MGILSMDVRTDAVKTVIVPAREDSVEALRSALQEMIAQAEQWLSAQGFDRRKSRIQTILDMRYKGQNYELEVRDCGPIDNKEGLHQAVAEFHRVHQRAYGYCNLEKPVEIVNIRVTISCPTRNDLEQVRIGKISRRVERGTLTREVLFDNMRQFVQTPILWRHSIGPDETFQGPIILESVDSTVVIPPDAKGKVDTWGNLIITC